MVKTRVQIRSILGDFAGGVGVGGGGGSGGGGAGSGGGNRGLVAELLAVARQGGLRSLYAGWVPRAVRAGPTCGIVLVAYEMAKNM